jgi:hypothetical protein
MVALPARPLMSAEEYLAWEPTQEGRHEYWDVELRANRKRSSSSGSTINVISGSQCELQVRISRSHTCQKYSAIFSSANNLVPSSNMACSP